MKLMTLTILCGLALGLTAGPADGESVPPGDQSYSVTRTTDLAFRGLDPTFPERPLDETWNDTADTDLDNSLETDTDQDTQIHLETDLNNDVHDPLLEDDTVEPVDLLPEDQTEPFSTEEPEARDPLKDPLP